MENTARKIEADETQSMTFANAEACLQMTLRTLPLKSTATDVDFLSKAMKAYAQMMLAEFLEGEKVMRAAPKLLEALKDMLPIVRFYLRARNGLEPDEYCADPSENFSSKYEAAFNVVSKLEGKK